MLIVVARSQSDDAAATEPGITDHWHAAYGVQICDELLPSLTSGSADPNGIHTHDDGVIHIHPGAAQEVARTGESATVQTFLEAAGSSISDDELTIRGPDGETTTYTEGADDMPCDGEVQIAYWANATEAADTDPRILTEDLADVFFRNDGEAYTIAFVADGTDILPPTTAGDLAELGAADGGAAPPPSTVPGSTTTPAGGATTTVPAGEPSATTTSAPPAG